MAEAWVHWLERYGELLGTLLFVMVDTLLLTPWLFYIL